MGKQTPTLLCVSNYGEVVKAQNLASITLCPSTKARRQSRAQAAGAVDTLCEAPNGKEQKERGEGFGKKALSMADRAKQQCVPFRLSTVHESWLTLTKYEGAFFFFFSQSSGAPPVIAMNQTSARLRAGPRGAAADVDSGDTGAISQLPGDVHGDGAVSVP